MHKQLFNGLRQHIDRLVGVRGNPDTEAAALDMAARGQEILKGASGEAVQIDLDEIIDLLKRAQPGLSHKHPAWYLNLFNLGVTLHMRFRRYGRIDDLKEAVGHFRQALAATSEGDSDRPLMLSYLALALQDRFGRESQTRDLEEAVQAYRSAVRTIRNDHPALYKMQLQLGLALKDRFGLSGRRQDIEDAIVAYRQAVGGSPEAHPARLGILLHLGDALRDKFERYGHREDLDEAVETFRQVVNSVSNDHADRPQCLGELADALLDRFNMYGRADDLEQAVEAFRQAVASTPEEDPDRPYRLARLTAALRAKFERHGRPEDLEEAIKVARRAIALSKPDQPDWALFLAYLGNALQDRFGLYGHSEDSEAAIEAHRQAVASIAVDNKSRVNLLNNLASSLTISFERFGRVPDLEDAIETYRQAIEAISANSPRLPGLMSNFGNALRYRFEKGKRPEDLEEAIKSYRQALGIARLDHIDRFMCLGNLGTALMRQFQLYERKQDLEDAIDTYRRAVDAALEDHAAHPGLFYNLGLALGERFQRFGQPEDLNEAAAKFRMAARSVSAPVHLAVQAGREWGRFAVLAHHWDEAVEALGETVELAGLVVSPVLGRADQEFRLGWLRGLGSEAAAACLMAGQVGRAVELFEQGRAVLFSRVLDARSDLTGLQRAYPDLAERFVRMRDVLDRPDPHPFDLPAEGDAGTTAVERRREAAAGLEEVLAEIRKRPGFEGFLLPRPVAELVAAAADGPVVLLNVDSLRSDALILSEGGVRVVPLQGVGPEEVRRQVIAFLAALDTGSESALAGVLEWLGERITGPVLDHLGYTTTPAPGAPWPRVWWSPSGALALLPLHAAGRHEVSGGPPDAVIDRVISSTVPTVRALLWARRTRPQGPEPRILVVAMPHTPGQADLPGVAHEADTLLGMFSGMVEVLGLPGTGPADYGTVMAALPRHPWVHFACHGESDLSDPSASHLLLNDYQTRPLTVLDLTGARLQDAELAFLSACTTARTGGALPDEPIHLAAACQLAGYRHVIASLWPINDADTAALTKDFYKVLANAPGTPHAVALHQATRRLRAIHRSHPSHWAPYTHTGP